ncbi:MAG TPA: Rieske 2Fe-2S domain-containing protein [Myxococcales bacterium]|nr:Rieske 2Fe-2S domain-containing protein [Myxococcales bacterium]
MPDDLTRRQLVRKAAVAACAPALARGLTGCARRISPNREVTAPTSSDGRLLLSSQVAPELQNPGGAVVAHSSCFSRPVLVANTGSGFLAMQANCPHAGCNVAWVPEDRQAECPCHGSRFAGDGNVLNPPARTPLQTWPASQDPASGNVEVHLFVGDGVFPAVQGGVVALDLSNYPALQVAGGAVVGQPEGMASPLLVTRPDANAAPLALNATCTHQQCTVQPVRASAQVPFTLYCPCHGSTFDLQGNVTHEPATFPLFTFPVEWDQANGVTITVGAICS